MTVSANQCVRSGDIVARPGCGELEHINGAVGRLPPVNMKVLTLLISRAGEVVTRHEIFDAVWQNQEVGDDVLTRCISDIRAELRRLAGNDQQSQPFIQTIPKRGYRWTETHTRPAQAEGSAQISAQPDPAGRPSSLWRTALGYALAVLLAVMTTIWLFRPDAGGAVRVALLPVAPSHSGVAADAASLDEVLTQRLHRSTGLQVLARSAMEAGRDRPLTYLHYEHSIRWIIEGRLRGQSGVLWITLSLVDARTALVEHMELYEVTRNGPSTTSIVDDFFEASGLIKRNELGHHGLVQAD